MVKSRAELVTSQAKFLEETKAKVQFQSIPLKSSKETMTQRAISHIQSELKIEQHPNMKEISIEEVMAQHMKEEQQRSFPSILKVKPEKKKMWITKRLSP